MTDNPVIPTFHPIPHPLVRYSSNSPRPPTPEPRAKSATPTTGGPRGNTHRTWASAVTASLLVTPRLTAHQPPKDPTTPSDEDDRRGASVSPMPKLIRSLTAGAEVQHHHVGKASTPIPTTISCKAPAFTPLSPADSDGGSGVRGGAGGKKEGQNGDEGLAVHREEDEEEVEGVRQEAVNKEATLPPDQDHEGIPNGALVPVAQSATLYPQATHEGMSISDARAMQLKAENPNKGLPQACLFIASLSSTQSDEQLHNSVHRHFEQYGTIMNVKVLKDWLHRPYAFVQFDRIEDARRALQEANNTMLAGRSIRVEPARVNRTLFIAKFSKTLSDQMDMRTQLNDILSRFGPIEELTILQNYQTGRSKGCGFVKYSFREDSIRAFLAIRNHYKWVAEWYAQNKHGTHLQVPPVFYDDSDEHSDGGEFDYSFSSTELQGFTPPPVHSSSLCYPPVNFHRRFPLPTFNNNNNFLHHRGARSLPALPAPPTTSDVDTPPSSTLTSLPRGVNQQRAANLDKRNVEVDRQSIFIGQLNQVLCTKELVEERFAVYGRIETCQFMNRMNTRPAFAFIKYSSEEEAEKAVQNENGVTWFDRQIRVQFRETGEFRLHRQPPLDYVPALGGFAPLQGPSSVGDGSVVPFGNGGGMGVRIMRPLIAPSESDQTEQPLSPGKPCFRPKGARNHPSNTSLLPYLRYMNHFRRRFPHPPTSPIPQSPPPTPSQQQVAGGLAGNPMFSYSSGLYIPQGQPYNMYSPPLPSPGATSPSMSIYGQPSQYFPPSPSLSQMMGMAPAPWNLSGDQRMDAGMIGIAVPPQVMQPGGLFVPPHVAMGQGMGIRPVRNHGLWNGEGAGGRSNGAAGGYAATQQQQQQQQASNIASSSPRVGSGYSHSQPPFSPPTQSTQSPTSPKVFQQARQQQLQQQQQQQRFRSRRPTPQQHYIPQQVVPQGWRPMRPPPPMAVPAPPPQVQQAMMMGVPAAYVPEGYEMVPQGGMAGEGHFEGE
ncbi:hypothetical protein HK097_000958, partial [Rhizophlyctis rosea]